MNKYWFILNGFPQSGKTTVGKIMNKYRKTINISTVDVIKKICKELGWNGEKDKSGRLALSDFKDLAVKHFDHSFNYVKSTLEDFVKEENQYEILLVDSREPNEIKRFVDELGFKTILVENKNVKSIPNNHADMNVKKYKDYDYVIYNDGTLEELESNIREFLNNLK